MNSFVANDYTTSEPFLNILSKYRLGIESLVVVDGCWLIPDILDVPSLVFGHCSRAVLPFSVPKSEVRDSAFWILQYF